MTKHTPATPLPQSGLVDALAVFSAAPNPQNAVALARADHRSGPLTDWPFIDQLIKAEARCIAYPRLVEALANLVRSGEREYVDNARALLRELGEE